MQIIRKCIFLLIIFLFTSGIANAANVGFVNTNIWLSKEKPIAGDSVRIYSVIVNDTDKKIQGRVVFYDNEEAISDQIMFVLEEDGESKVINMNWTATEGEHRFKAQIFNAVSVDGDSVMEQIDSSTMSQATDLIIVDIDSDNDGLSDGDEEEIGTDPNNPDSDNDGDMDGEDPDPINPQVFNGDDTDGDRVSDMVDTDIDNDGLYNWEEEEIGTDLYLYDTDSDGYGDKDDAFPMDPNIWQKRESVNLNSTGVLKDDKVKSEKISIEKVVEVDDIEKDIGIEKKVLGVKVVEDSGLYTLASSKYIILALVIALTSLLSFLILTKDKKVE